MKKNTERGLTPLPGDQGARSARTPSIRVNGNPYAGSGSQGPSMGSDGYYRPGITATTVPSKIQTAITMPDRVIPNRYPRLIIFRHLRAKRIL